MLSCNASISPGKWYTHPVLSSLASARLCSSRDILQVRTHRSKFVCFKGVKTEGGSASDEGACKLIRDTAFRVSTNKESCQGDFPIDLRPSGMTLTLAIALHMQASTHIQTHTYIHMYIHMHMHIYIYIRIQLSSSQKTACEHTTRTCHRHMWSKIL